MYVLDQAKVHAICTLGALALGLSLYTVTRGRTAHRTLGIAMAGQGLVFGALLIPAIFARVPGRLIHRVFFG